MIQEKIDQTPTLKWGVYGDLLKYPHTNMEREWLKKFINDNLGIECGPKNLELCSPDMEVKLERLMMLTPDQLSEKMKTAPESELPMMNNVMSYLRGEL